MSDILSAYNKNKIWTFKGGIHPPEMKVQSNQTPLRHLPPPTLFHLPINQHAGKDGELLVKVGDHVLKGQMLTLGDGLRELPVHAPTSGTVVNISPYAVPHPSGMADLCIHLQADGKDEWRERFPLPHYQDCSKDKLIQRIYEAGIAGLGGGVFPTGAKMASSQEKIKLLIINGAECEPYITCDDRLMQDYAEELVTGVRIAKHILQAEKAVIAVEDNKSDAIATLRHTLKGAKDIDIRVVPTKYPSGAAKQLIYLLTGQEVPSGKRSSSIGVLMLNVGTTFAIKRAVIDDEPLMERAITLTGNLITERGNYWVPFGTPINYLLAQVGYQAKASLPIFVGGPLMGFTLPHLNAPVTKLTNCFIAPDEQEYSQPEAELACIRCGACSDACPVQLLPQQLYWFAREENHEKSQQYALKDCIECGVCAYVCPSHIPLVQYFRQEKAKIAAEKEKAHKAEEAKLRFEARLARLDKEMAERKARTQKLAETRRAEITESQGHDPVQQALARLKAKKALAVKEEANHTDVMAERKARRLAKQAENIKPAQKPHAPISEQDFSHPKKQAVMNAIARAKAKKLAQETPINHNVAISEPHAPISEQDFSHPKKQAVMNAIARAKAKKLAQETPINHNVAISESHAPISEQDFSDPKKQTVMNAIARAKAKKLAQETPINHNVAISESHAPISEQDFSDPKKQAVMNAIARAKAKKLAKLSEQNKEEKDV